MNYFSTFHQSTWRAWIWFALILLNVVNVVFAIINGAWGSMLSFLFIAMGVYWIDRLEKEITRRNKERIK